MKKSGVQIIVYNFMYLIISFVIFQMIVIYTKLNYDSIINIINMVGNRSLYLLFLRKTT